MPPSLTLYLEGPLAREALATLAQATGIKAQELPPSEAPTRDDLLSMTANLLEVTFAVGFVAEKLWAWYQHFRQKDSSARLTCVSRSDGASLLTRTIVRGRAHTRGGNEEKEGGDNANVCIHTLTLQHLLCRP